MQSRCIRRKLFLAGVPPSLCCKVVEKVLHLSYKGVFRPRGREKLDLKLGCLKLGCLDAQLFFGHFVRDGSILVPGLR